MFRNIAILICCFFVYSVSAESATQTERSSGGRLRYYGAEQEDFFVSPDYSSVVRASDGNLVQKKYDTQYRLIKKVTWNKDNSMPSSIAEYTYDNGAFPVSSQVQEITSARFISEIYNTSGLVIRREVYSTAKSDDGSANATITDDDAVENATVSNSTTGTKFLISTHNWEYDKNNRVVEELIEYADDLKQSEKTEYDFLAGEDRPDVFHYRGGVLFKKTVYSSPDDWEESVYFPGEIEIKTIYQERTAVSEQFYRNGTKIRERKR